MPFDLSFSFFKLHHLLSDYCLGGNEGFCLPRWQPYVVALLISFIAVSYNQILQRERLILFPT